MRLRARPLTLALPGIDLDRYGRRAVTPAARATVRMRTRREAPAPKPWLCVLLAVDTACTSGWCISVAGEREDSGEVDTLDAAELARVVRCAVNLGEARALPVVLVLEAPWGGSMAVLVALGAARERWLRAWRDVDQAAGRVVRVVPSTWRSAVLGGRFVSAPREETREQEQLVARAIVGRAVGSDEAAAVCIARWAGHAAAVGRAIGRRAAKASLRAWTSSVPLTAAAVDIGAAVRRAKRAKRVEVSA